MRRKHKRQAAEKRISYDLGDREVHLTLRTSRRARRVRLEVSARRGVTLVVPHAVPKGVALRFLDEKKEWLRKRLEKLEVRERLVEGDFGHPPQILYLGERFPVELKLDAKAVRPHVQRERDRLVLLWPVLEEPSAAELKWAFETFYRLEASELFSDIYWDTAQRMRLDVTSPTIRGQKTLWGSYSSSGRVSLNWKLMMAPRGAVRYVIVHELCHALERNHSPRFWKHVARICPDYQTWRAWLNVHSDLIQRLATFEHLEVLLQSEPFRKREKARQRA